MSSPQQSTTAVAKLRVHCVSAGVGELRSERRHVLAEAPVTIDIADAGSYTIMCTPCDQMAMAVGFVFSEGMIRTRDDIAMLVCCPDDPNVIRMKITGRPGPAAGRRNLLIVSSCGICGSDDMRTLMASLPVVGDALRVGAGQLTDWIEQLHGRQRLFRSTGSAHAAGIVHDGELTVVCEDLGRHTALDKAIGTCLLKGLPTAGGIALLSGRVSFEIVAKAARAGIELIAAVSAPSSLAVEAAQRCNITLCGFVRGRDATLYCHPERIAP